MVDLANASGVPDIISAVTGEAVPLRDIDRHSYRGKAGADTDTGLLPVREFPQDRDVGHLSMSPRMK